MRLGDDVAVSRCEVGIVAQACRSAEESVPLDGKPEVSTNGQEFVDRGIAKLGKSHAEVTEAEEEAVRGHFGEEPRCGSIRSKQFDYRAQGEGRSVGVGRGDLSVSDEFSPLVGGEELWCRIRQRAVVCRYWVELRVHGLGVRRYARLFGIRLSFRPSKEEPHRGQILDGWERGCSMTRWYGRNPVPWAAIERASVGWCEAVP